MRKASYNIARLDMRRLVLGWSLQRLAAKADVHYSSLYRFFRRGSQNPDVAIKVARAMKVDLEDYVTRKGA